MNMEALSPVVARSYGLRSRFPMVRESALRSPRGEVVRSRSLALPGQGNGITAASRESDKATEPPAARYAHAVAATALVVRRQALIPGPRGYWLEAVPRALINEGMGTLPSTVGAGTAFLVTPQHFVTAAHVLDQHWVANAAFVFDFHADCLRQPEGDLPLRYEIPEGAIAYGESIVGPNAKLSGDDITVVKLTQATTRSGIAIAQFDAIAKGQMVAMVGCARMQPMTLVAEIEGESAPQVFDHDARIVHTNIEAFQGNSGSALLDAAGDVLGVQVGISSDDDIDVAGSADTDVDSDVAVASAVRMRVIREILEQIGAEIRS